MLKTKDKNNIKLNRRLQKKEILMKKQKKKFTAIFFWKTRRDKAKCFAMHLFNEIMYSIKRYVHSLEHPSTQAESTRKNVQRRQSGIRKCWYMIWNIAVLCVLCIVDLNAHNILISLPFTYTAPSSLSDQRHWFFPFQFYSLSAIIFSSLVLNKNMFLICLMNIFLPFLSIFLVNPFSLVAFLNEPNNATKCTEKCY